MACDRSSSRVGTTAAVKSGVSTLQSKIGNVAGRTMKTLERGLGRSATAALTVANSFDPPRSIDTLLPLAAVGALLGNNQTRQRIMNVVGTAQVARAVTTGLGTGLGRLSKSDQMRACTYFNGKVHLRSWPSRLTPFLNASDVQGFPVKVEASLGQLVESRGKSWHLGVTLVKSSQGERTIAHLQSLTLPATHFYFTRALREKEVAGIISGQPEFDPKHLPGFAGEVTEVESLAPAVAHLKKRLIQMHIFGGGKPT